MGIEIDVKQVQAGEVEAMRDLYRQEMNCQIVHDSYHRRGFTTPYLAAVNGRTAGYGLVTNGSHRAVPAGTLAEAYLLPVYRGLAVPIFRQLIDASHVSEIEAQTNDPLQLLLLYDFGVEISSNVILFHDSLTTSLSLPDAVFRKAVDADPDPPGGGDWVLEVAGRIVGSGGFLTHYNPPYGDIFMEIAEPYRRRGFGSYLVQELKKVCYETGRRPAARCNAANVASRRTMEKAGLLPCGRILVGHVRR